MEKINRLIFSFLLATIVWTAGCTMFARHSDPLVGWKPEFNSRPSDQIIEKDYQDYIQKLPPKERTSAGPIFYFEDGTGQQAVKIEIGVNGTSWVHVLIYDKDNKRIKVIKYVAGHYAC
jgi:hypothetical protein